MQDSFTFILNLIFNYLHDVKEKNVSLYKTEGYL